ncbi:MAG: endonuclease V [Desulfobacteraceae bacterium]|nr:MAG: endonuclease V [Desulfobacteraceae bacterium]
MIAAFDVHYMGDEHASCAALLFFEYADAEPAFVYTHLQPSPAGYVSGEFYKRELPCILKLLEGIDQAIDEIMIDGYVHLERKPGLGHYLFESLGGRIPIIGVAKTKFAGSAGAEVLRGRSRRPLYITAAGLSLPAACAKVRAMHGAHRIPTLLKQVDRIARKGADFHPA